MSRGLNDPSRSGLLISPRRSLGPVRIPPYRVTNYYYCIRIALSLFANDVIIIPATRGPLISSRHSGTSTRLRFPAQLGSRRGSVCLRLQRRGCANLESDTEEQGPSRLPPFAWTARHYPAIRGATDPYSPHPRSPTEAPTIASSDPFAPRRCGHQSDACKVGVRPSWSWTAT